MWVVFVVKRMCFVVNPFAGIGGPLALKGTPRSLVVRAAREGYELLAPKRALQFVERLVKISGRSLRRVEVMTASEHMGYSVFKPFAGLFAGVEIVHRYDDWPTSRNDTIATVKACVRRGAGLIVFVGGDGTAYDVLEALKSQESSVPVLGVPSGVKMFSSVFAYTAYQAALAVYEWIEGKASICEGEVVDYDEDAYREGVLRIRLRGLVNKICSVYVVGSTKQSVMGASVEENRKAIARYVVESMEECTLYILGPGSTVAYIARELGVEKTLLGVDVVHNRRLIGRDLSENALYSLVSSHISRGGRAKLVLSPIGGQGFLLGRGNQQISPRIIRLIGKSGLIIVADREKIYGLRGKPLRVDTGDSVLDKQLRGYYRVVVDYGEEYVVRVE